MDSNADIISEYGSRLIESARRAALQAYAPYSKFRVGASLMVLDGEPGNFFVGCNVENASYGATICAERVAINSAIVSGNRKIHLLALSLPDVPAEADLADRSPCGICRQVIHEFSVPGTTQILIDRGGDSGDFDVIKPETLLPHGFRL